ncbi:hypothetical protein [Falsirhodobacter sp. 20TX0035]|uniref:hypothetical protein n=1 Tax=Falsirhodobacter sp. 20TX0035 TaxID=3022019 RepID=UPI00232BE838|nr:hypothetical protein [Falsirhodobacter sp. 20TX0035]MDB6453569.1 hypothetical protein [Falsirhodobacter sp. 20TX0035]
MPFYREYKRYEVHLEGPFSDQDPYVGWKVLGFGKEHAAGDGHSRQDAFEAACAAINRIEADPYRFAINLIGYPDHPEGDVITDGGEVLGRWCISTLQDEIRFIDFYPPDASVPLFSDRSAWPLCAEIREWHEAQGDGKPDPRSSAAIAADGP